MIWLFPVIIAMNNISCWWLLKKMQWGNCVFWTIYYIFNEVLAIVFAIAN
ncbi:hypothetical protein [Limosilactobacillus vaginalis]|nr:hypothetical protein [Limosilactobacillus vaginalis]HJG17655.1 hypothetical protein [Limosilactobacillus vaginalis]